MGHGRDEVLYPAHRWALPGCCHQLVYQTGLGIHLGLEAQDGALAWRPQAAATACSHGGHSYGIHLMSDNGSQLTSKRYEKELETLGIEHVTTSYNNPKGNAETGRFMRTFKEEVVWPNEFETVEEAIRAAENFFRFYNEGYPHSTIGEQTPIDFERTLVPDAHPPLAQSQMPEAA